MKYHVFVLSIVLSLALSGRVEAQRDSNSWTLGIFGGINHSAYSTKLFHFPVGTPVGFVNGSATASTIGISAERPLVSLQHLGVLMFMLKTHYDPSPGAFISINGYTVDDSGRYYDSKWVNTDVSYLNANALLKLSFGSQPSPNGFYIACGPSIGLLTSQNFNVKIWRTEVTTDKTTLLSSTTYPIDDASKFRFGVNSEIGYDLSISDKMGVCVFAGNDTPLTKLSEDFDWKVNFDYASIALKYTLQ